MALIIVYYSICIVNIFAVSDSAVSSCTVSGFADGEYEVDGENIIVRGKLAPHEFKYWEIQS